MKIVPPLSNLGDKHKVFTHPSMDWVMTEYDGDNLIIKKKDIPELVLALIGTYFEESDDAGVRAIVIGVKKKLDIYKFKKTKNA